VEEGMEAAELVAPVAIDIMVLLLPGIGPTG
jgi:hypothetical protein